MVYCLHRLLISLEVAKDDLKCLNNIKSFNWVDFVCLFYFNNKRLICLKQLFLTRKITLENRMDIQIQNPNPIIHHHREVLSELDLEIRKSQELDEDILDQVDSLEGLKVFYTFYLFLFLSF